MARERGWIGFAVWATALALMLALGACSSDEEQSTGTGTFFVQAASGGTVALTGTWTTGCYTASGVDTVEWRTFEGNTILMLAYTYGTSNASCGPTETVDGSGTGTVTDTGTVTAAGWTNVSSAQPAPTANGGGSLPANPDFTTGSFTGTFNGTPYSNEPLGGFYVDDTATPWKLFRTNRNPWDPCSSDGTASGNEMCLMTVDFFNKVP